MGDYIKKTKKGITLIEVVVALAIFSIISVTLFSTVIGMKKVVSRQEEYVRLEMTCYDINAYYVKYGKSWYKYYFGNEVEKSKGYLTYDFKPTTDEACACYVIFFSENEIKCIASANNSETVFVENISLPIKKE